MPQAICTRYGLSMGAKAAPIVRVLLVLFFPVAYPISKVRPGRAQMLLSFFATIREEYFSCGCNKWASAIISLIYLPSQGDLLVLCSSSHPKFQTTQRSRFTDYYLV
jgi:hypothetical protein